MSKISWLLLMNCKDTNFETEKLDFCFVFFLFFVVVIRVFMLLLLLFCFVFFPRLLKS